LAKWWSTETLTMKKVLCSIACSRRKGRGGLYGSLLYLWSLSWNT
jgi:hypothetical protein